ncbi:MFS transporter [Bradyrhizobium canariense]|uniref:Drug resistance transporter, EmrB/QacA subfamily n=1 Tax=Bradyrhizobium canariense TaxID=255045 RepID=A0A1H1PIC0_9BRAD|nr:MFS transporter [Bradyrhizobium canariense]SDS10853.1 drug resistance transporter, EmrB/QacA subfamily [Bradyrhizobium canariense]
MSTQAEEPTGRTVAAVEIDARGWFALPVLLAGAFLPPLDFTIVNLALPAIRQNLGATSSDVQLVISAYAATYAVFLITGGRLGDLYGRKRVFLTGVVGFTLASALCGAAWSPSALIAGRILQGIMATVMAPQVLASIRVLFSGAAQGRALALYGATFGLANLCGQLLGGVLVSSHPFGLTWQAIFFVNVPIGLATAVGGLVFLRDSRSEHAQRLDVGGVVLLSLTLGLLVYPLVEGREAGWPWWIAVMLAASPVALTIFILFEKWLDQRGGSPLVELALFRERRFATGIAMALAFYMQNAFFLTFSVYLQNGLHLTPMDAGIATLPYVIGSFVASLASSHLMQRLGPYALTLGFALQAFGFFLLMLAVETTLPGSRDIGLAAAGMGFGIIMPSVIKAVVGGIDHRHAGLASGVVISALQIGSALGVAIIGGVFYSALGSGQSLPAYAHAFALALGCIVAVLILGGALSVSVAKASHSIGSRP